MPSDRETAERIINGYTGPDYTPTGASLWLVNEIVAALGAARAEERARHAPAASRAVEDMRERAASITQARCEAERIMRDDARKAGDRQFADIHADRAHALAEAVTAIRALPLTVESDKGTADER